MKEAIENDFWATLTKAEIALETAKEQLHEVKCEAEGEAYAFGDAGVGAFKAICRQELEVQGLRYRFEALFQQQEAA